MPSLEKIMISARQNAVRIVHKEPNSDIKMVEVSQRSDTKETQEMILSNSN